MTLAGHSEELRWRLALLRAPQVGPRGFQSLLGRFGSAREVFAAPAEALAALGLRRDTLDWLRRPGWERVDGDLRWLEAGHRHCLVLGEPGYPALLAEIADPPPLLFVEGSAEALAARQMALVGSRNPSPVGSKAAFDFARALAGAGFAVTSGLALGIDAAAHRGALERGGATLAVAGTGLDIVYPRSHQALAESIVAGGGALVSEFPVGTPPQAGNFPRRNRIISGLSLGVVVVQAALKSGSLITARMASEQGREVFALPGSIHDPLARGCHFLIKQGAKLAESVDDILEEFSAAWLAAAPPPPGPPAGVDLGPEGARLLKYIAHAPTSVDTLVAATGIAPEAIASLLLALELQGHIVLAEGGYSRVR